MYSLFTLRQRGSAAEASLPAETKDHTLPPKNSFPVEPSSLTGLTHRSVSGDPQGACFGGDVNDSHKHIRMKTRLRLRSPANKQTPTLQNHMSEKGGNAKTSKH